MLLTLLTNFSTVKLFAVLLCQVACVIIYNIIFIYNLSEIERKNWLNIIKVRCSFLYVVSIVCNPYLGLVLKIWIVIRTILAQAKIRQWLSDNIKLWVFNNLSNVRLNFAWIGLFMAQTKTRIPLPRIEDAPIGLVENSGGMTEFAIDPYTGQKKVVGVIVAGSENLVNGKRYHPENWVLNLNLAKTLFELRYAGYDPIRRGMLQNAVDPSMPDMFYWLNTIAGIDYNYYLFDYITSQGGKLFRSDSEVTSMLSRKLPITNELINGLSGLKMVPTVGLNLPFFDTVVLAPRCVEDSYLQYKILERLVEEHNSLPYKDPLKKLLLAKGYRFAKENNLLHLVRAEMDSEAGSGRD